MDSKEKYEDIITDVTAKLAKIVFMQEGTYTLKAVENRCNQLLDDLISSFRYSSPKWQEAIKGAYQEYISKTSNDTIPCRKCGVLHKSSDLKSGELKKKVGGSLPIGIFAEEHIYISQYFSVCETCLDEITYQFYDLHCKCKICYKRYSPFGTDSQIFSNFQIRALCETCRRIPDIWKEVERVNDHLERAVKFNLPATLTIKQWVATLDHFDWKCAYNTRHPFENLEHYLSINLGGGTIASNCVPSCLRCNVKKHNRHPDQLDGLFPPDNLARIRQYLSEQSA